MKKGFSRILGLFLALSLVLGIGIIPMATTAFAAEEEIHAPPGAGYVYLIQHVATGEYMDVGGTKEYFDFTSGNSVVLKPASGSPNQLWRLVEYDGGYRIMSVGKPGMMLSALWNNHGDGQPINARSRGSILSLTNAQRFAFTQLEDEAVRIDTTGEFLARSSCIGYDGIELVQRSLSDNPPDECRWKFIRADSVADKLADWFSKDSSEYNSELAAWAMELAYAAYHPIPWFPYEVLMQPTVKQIDAILIRDGFDTSKDMERYDTHGDLFNFAMPEWKLNSIGYTIGHRDLEFFESEDAEEPYDTRPLIIVAMRGTVPVEEWISNIIPLGDKDKWHLGFRIAKDDVKEKFKTYLDDHELAGKRPIVLVTGHSRGAGIANILAVDTEFNSIVGGKENIFAYTYATPNVQRGLKSELSDKSKYGNVYNILNRNDVVTLVPRRIVPLANLMCDDGWNRYGEDINITMSTARLVQPVSSVIKAHVMSTYFNHMLSWLGSDIDAMRNYAKITEKDMGILPRLISWKCPVDITLYDGQGNVAAKIINEVAYNTDSGEAFAWVTEDGEKCFFLPYGAALDHAEVVARDNGTMHMGIAKVDAAEEVPSNLKTFENILLEKGREYYVDLSEDIAIDDVRLMVTENDVIIGEVATDGVTTVPVRGISIVGDHQRTLTVGQTTLVTASYTPTLPTNRTIIWDSSNEAVATVDIDGVVTAHSVGGAIITGTSQDGGYKAQCIITVEPATEISILGDQTIILTPAQQHQLTADVTINSVSRPISWSSSNEAVAVVSTNGMVTGISLGTAIITATTKDGKTASVAVNVESKTTITIMGDPTRILTLGQQQQLFANVTNNSTSLPLTWTSSNTAVVLVTVDGIVSAQSVGSAMITATTQDGYVAQVMITVEAGTAITIAGEPTRILVQGQQLQLTADVTNNSTALPITWTSSNSAVAPVTATGLVTAQSVGSAIITAKTNDGFSAQVLVTVEAETVISIVGDPTRILKLGQQSQLLANVTQNSSALPVTWTSNNEAVATVSTNGLVSTLSLGTAMITATTKDGKTAQVMINVEATTAISIPGDPTRILNLSQQLQLTADVTNSSTALPITWSSSNEAVAPVSTNGLVTALAAGNAIITAKTNDGFSAQVMITVEAPTTISIAGDANRIATMGTSLQLSVNVTQNSTALPLTWVSSNTAVATVSADGLVTPKAIGSTMITVTTKDGKTAQVMVTVEAPTTISIEGAATRIIPLNLSEQLFATVTQNSTALPLTWVSSNTAVATVNENGIVTSKAIGSAMVTVTTKDGKSAQVMVTVEVPTTLSISGKPSGDLVVGKPHQLTANVPHNSTALPITWTSSNEAVATISETGLITPKKPGNTIITATTNDGLSEQFIVTVVKQEFWLWRWLKTFFGWLAKPFIWLWNAISWPFRAIGKL